jgi:hypothetical protein
MFNVHPSQTIVIAKVFVKNGFVIHAQVPITNCWSATSEHYNLPTNSKSMEGSRGGRDYNTLTIHMEWDFKTNLWEWENITMVYLGQ